VGWGADLAHLARSGQDPEGGRRKPRSTGLADSLGVARKTHSPSPVVSRRITASAGQRHNGYPTDPAYRDHPSPSNQPSGRGRGCGDGDAQRGRRPRQGARPPKQGQPALGKDYRSPRGGRNKLAGG
jgi:hypothetical protein